MEQNIMHLFLVCCISFLLNIPMGYFRRDEKKFSIKWFFFIHLPVPILAMIKSHLSVELTWGFAPFYFVVYFIGQLVGKKYLPRFIESCKIRYQ